MWTQGGGWGHVQQYVKKKDLPPLRCTFFPSSNPTSRHRRQYITDRYEYMRTIHPDYVISNNMYTICPGGPMMDDETGRNVGVGLAPINDRWGDKKNCSLNFLTSASRILWSEYGRQHFPHPDTRTRRPDQGCVNVEWKRARGKPLPPPPARSLSASFVERGNVRFIRRFLIRSPFKTTLLPVDFDKVTQPARGRSNSAERSL